MNQWFGRISVPAISALLLAAVLGLARAAQPTQQPNARQNQQQSNSGLNPRQSNSQQRQQPRSNAHQKGMRTFTGKVTTGGGFIAQNGMEYRLNGARAAGLRNYVNKSVTIQGHETKFEGHNAIDVESFRAGQSNMAQNGQNNMKNPRSQSNFRSQPQGRQPPQPGHTGYTQKQNQQPAENR